MKNKVKQVVLSASFTCLFLALLSASLNVILSLRYNSHLKHRFSGLSADARKNYYYSGLNDSDIVALLRESYISNGWVYESRTGFRESERHGKFVNVSSLGFRRNSKTMPTDELLIQERSESPYILFLGGSTSFGYGVADYQSIPAYVEAQLSNEERLDVRVANFGRGYYYSKQENDLLEELLTKGARKPIAVVFLDGLNERCDIEVYQRQMKSIFAIASNARFSWSPSEYAKPFTYILNRLADRAKKRVGVHVKKELTCPSKYSAKITLIDVFAKQLARRANICTANDLRCYSFLQPLPGYNNIHSAQTKESEDLFRHRVETLKPLFSKRPFFDLSSSLSSLKGHAFIDNVHYSAQANKAIAREISATIVLELR